MANLSRAGETRLRKLPQFYTRQSAVGLCQSTYTAGRERKQRVVSATKWSNHMCKKQKFGFFDNLDVDFAKPQGFRLLYIKFLTGIDAYLNTTKYSNTFCWPCRLTNEYSYSCISRFDNLQCNHGAAGVLNFVFLQKWLHIFFYFWPFQVGIKWKPAHQVVSDVIGGESPLGSQFCTLKITETSVMVREKVNLGFTSSAFFTALTPPNQYESLKILCYFFL